MKPITSTYLVKQLLLKIVKAIFWLHIAYLFVVGCFLFYYINHNPRYTSLMLQRSEYQFKNTPKPTFIELRHVPKQFKSSIVLLEDPNFYKHYGVDPGAIKRARKLNKKYGYKAYGGSTITQQLSRTLFLTQHKNYFRKYLELLTALELELMLGKDRILELYINYAEWGKDIYGVQDASLHYYGAKVQRINTDEQMRLITILASPIKYTPSNFTKRKILRTRYKFLYKNL